MQPIVGETKVTGVEKISGITKIALAGIRVTDGSHSLDIFKNLGITAEVNKMEITEDENVYENPAALNGGSN